MAAVTDYLEGVDPAAAARARRRYSCFDEFGGDQEYGRAASFGVSDSCRRGVVEQLVELRRSADAYLRRDGIAETRAVEPLERTGGLELGEPPETYPSAL